MRAGYHVQRQERPEPRASGPTRKRIDRTSAAIVGQGVRYAHMAARPPYPSVVSVVNLKGGVGKTTLCVNLAYGLAYFLSRKVLLIDLDPQANATQYLISQQTYRKLYLDDKQRLTVHELYQEHQMRGLGSTAPPKSPKSYIQRVYDGHGGCLDLVASRLELGLLAFEGGHVQQNDQVRWLIESVGSEYDVVLIDSPPTISRMLIGGFEASEHVLVPVKPDFLSSIGLPLLDRVVHQVYSNQLARRPPWMKPLTILGLVYTMVIENLTMTQESLEEISKLTQQLKYPIFTARIASSTKFTWSAKRTLPIFRTEPSSKHGRDLSLLVSEFDHRLVNATKHT
jgi:chromosome partitioning protein